MKPLPPINGLVLAGGQSRRMGRDKASLVYEPSGHPEWRRMVALLQPFCEKVFISVRREQDLEGHCPEDAPLLVDCVESAGPLTGLLTAFSKDSQSAWLALACDLPMLGKTTLQHLVDHRGSGNMIAYRSASDGLPEPLCALYEPASRERLIDSFRQDIRCPRKILINAGAAVTLLDLPDPQALENANSPEDYDRLRRQIMESSAR